MAFDFAQAYLAASPGDVITVPAGTYNNVRIPFRSDLLGKGNVNDPSTLITFDIPNPIVCNGEFDIVGSAVYLKGRASPFGVGATLKVNSSLHPIADSSSQYPTNVVIEGADVVTLGCYSALNVVFRNIDVGPASITSNGGSCFTEEGGGIDENKLSQRIGPVPKNILYEGVRFHEQNSKNRQGRESGDFGGGCHWGGFFLVNGDGVRFYRSKWECNVVYNVQVQNFSGPASRNVTFEECAFGLPVHWTYDANCQPNGQDSIQFSGSGEYVGFLIKNCAIAGPAGKMIGYYGGGSVPPSFSNIVVQGTVVYPDSGSAPPVPGGVTPPPPPPTDTQAPSVPQNLAASQITQTSFVINWSPSIDNVGVTGYNVYLGSTKVATVTGTSNTFTGLNPGTVYSASVEAFDAAGNKSNRLEAEITVTTASVTPPPPAFDMNAQYDKLETTNTHQRWAKANPNEAIRVETYWRSGGTKPAAATPYGDFLVDVAEELRK